MATSILPTRHLLLSLGLASGVLAAQAQTTINIPLWGYDAQPAIDASIVAVSNQVTTMRIYCAPDASGSLTECGMFPNQYLTIGPSTYLMDLSDEGFTGTQNCELPAATAAPPLTAVCAESYAGSEANDPGSTTETYTDGMTYAVTVTAGASLLKQAAATTTTGASGTGHTAIPAGASGGTATGSITTHTPVPISSGGTATTASTASITAQPGAAHAVNAQAYGVVGVAAGLLGALYI